MSWISIAVAVLFFLLGGACVLAVVVQLPGAWFLLALALLVELTDALYLPPGARTTFSSWVWGVGIALALLGEILESVAAAVGLRRGGGSRRGLIGALIGAFAGLFLTPFFAFVPFLGPFLAVLLGTFAGALIGELSAERRSVGAALRPAWWAVIGRLFGTTGKVALALVVWLAFSTSAFWR